MRFYPSEIEPSVILTAAILFIIAGVFCYFVWRVLKSDRKSTVKYSITAGIGAVVIIIMFYAGSLVNREIEAAMLQPPALDYNLFNKIDDNKISELNSKLSSFREFPIRSESNYSPYKIFVCRNDAEANAIFDSEVKAFHYPIYKTIEESGYKVSVAYNKVRRSDVEGLYEPMDFFDSFIAFKKKNVIIIVKPATSSREPNRCNDVLSEFCEGKLPRLVYDLDDTHKLSATPSEQVFNLNFLYNNRQQITGLELYEKFMKWAKQNGINPQEPIIINNKLVSPQVTLDEEKNLVKIYSLNRGKSIYYSTLDPYKIKFDKDFVFIKMVEKEREVIVNGKKVKIIDYE